MARKTISKKPVDTFNIKIEKNIPVPSQRGHNEYIEKLKNLLNSLVPGESFLIPEEFHDKTKYFPCYISKVNVEEKKLESGKFFITRKVEGGRRVWRFK